MTITITLEQQDISADQESMIALAIVLQAFAKMRERKSAMTEEAREKFKEFNDTVLKPNGKTEVSVESEKKSEGMKAAEVKSESKADRAKMESEIKKMALEGKERGITKKIKSMLEEYGVEKLQELEDEKVEELLSKVKAL